MPAKGTVGYDRLNGFGVRYEPSMLCIALQRFDFVSVMIPFFRLPINTLAGSRLIELDSRRLRKSGLITIPEMQLLLEHSLLVKSH